MANVPSTILKMYVNNISEMKKSISLENPGERFTLKISANQRFGTCAVRYDSLRIVECTDSLGLLLIGASLELT